MIVIDQNMSNNGNKSNEGDPQAQYNSNNTRVDRSSGGYVKGFAPRMKDRRQYGSTVSLTSMSQTTPTNNNKHNYRSSSIGNRGDREEKPSHSAVGNTLNHIESKMLDNKFNQTINNIPQLDRDNPTDTQLIRIRFLIGDILRFKRVCKVNPEEILLNGESVQFLWVFVRELLDLSMEYPKTEDRLYVGSIIAHLLRSKTIQLSDCMRGLKEFFNEMDKYDKPNMYTYVAHYLAPSFRAKLLDFHIIKIISVLIIENGAGGALLKSICAYLQAEYGTQFVRDLWTQSHCQIKDFEHNERVEVFVNKYGLEYLSSEPVAKISPPTNTCSNSTVLNINPKSLEVFKNDIMTIGAREVIIKNQVEPACSSTKILPATNTCSNSTVSLNINAKSFEVSKNDIMTIGDGEVNKKNQVEPACSSISESTPITKSQPIIESPTMEPVSQPTPTDIKPTDDNNILDARFEAIISCLNNAPDSARKTSLLEYIMTQLK